MVYRAISHQVKELLTRLYLQGYLTREEIVGLGIISASTFQRATKAWTGRSLPARKMSSGRTRILGVQDTCYVLARLQQCSDLMLDELAQDLEAVGGPRVSKSVMSRTLKRLDITRKKLKKRALEASMEKRAECMLRMAQYYPEQLVFCDESGFDSRDGNRRFGWAERGKSAHKAVSGKRSARASLVASLSVSGIIAPKVYHINLNTRNFVDYLAGYLLPLMMPFPGPRSVLVLDNVPFHRSLAVRDVVERFDE